jgi:hypothetical protein
MPQQCHSNAKAMLATVAGNPVTDGHRKSCNGEAATVTGNPVSARLQEIL